MPCRTKTIDTVFLVVARDHLHHHVRPTSDKTLIFEERQKKTQIPLNQNTDLFLDAQDNPNTKGNKRQPTIQKDGIDERPMICPFPASSFKVLLSDFYLQSPFSQNRMSTLFTQIPQKIQITKTSWSRTVEHAFDAWHFNQPLNNVSLPPNVVIFKTAFGEWIRLTPLSTTCRQTF